MGKKTVKKVIEQEVVQVIDLSQPFDLVNVTPARLKEYAAYLEQMIVTPGWKLMEAVLNANIEVLGEQIISKADVAGTQLTDADVELLRVQHAQIKQLLKKPSVLIAQYKGDNRPSTMAEYDPYSKRGQKSEFVNNAQTMSNTT